MTTHQDQAALYRRLREVLGDQHATTLMAMLPARNDLATRQGLSALGDEFRSEMALMRSEMATKSELKEFKQELKAEIAGLRGEVREEIGGIRGEISGLRGEMQSFVRTFMITQTTAIVGVAGLVFAITRFL